MLREWIEKEYAPRNGQEVQSALRQVMQQIVLAGLFRARFFEHAAFYGGTALRIFYGLPRFSEDLDFSLLRPQADFTLAPYLRALETECRSLGIEVTTRSKHRRQDSDIDTAFLNSRTQIRELLLQTDRYTPARKEVTSVKVKLEVDVNPPLGFAFLERLMLKPFSCYIKCFKPADLMAGKLHALLFRRWKRRVKGRDWYDLEWYIKEGVTLNLDHLRQRMMQSGDWPREKPFKRPDLMQLLEEKVHYVDLNQARSDVQRFLPDPTSLQIWSKTYFLDLIRHLRCL